ncbi:unnamed protein product [Microthlaspi erraticum]|uniref:F-box associated beta-propeller type 1 domain-containing protein n=1 Tax=Microthlaspi erraticum TaxID=1685480 RepID=A0A6D2JHI9_9BRAS|nr:unnamed protein product [Microthlaspi erraticum]
MLARLDSLKLDSLFGIRYDEISKSRRKYKVLRFGTTCLGNVRCEIYYINPSKDDVTMPITINTEWDIEFYARGASLNGNTYWFAQQLLPHPVDISEVPDYLICYDFTTERFGQPLSLPFHSYAEDTVSLSSVRDEQLAVLYQHQFTLRMEIWITTKIDPQVVSWSKSYMLAVDMEPLIGQHQFYVVFASFFVDEEKKVAVVLDLARPHSGSSLERVAYIVGEDGYFKKEELIGGGSDNTYHGPHVCSFVPKFSANQTRRQKEENPLC